MAACNCLKCLLLPQRVNIAIMGFLAIVIAYTMRACLTVAITQMVLPKNQSESNMTTKNITSSRPVGDMYDWSQQQQCWILSSFYVGYVIAHIPGGVLAQKCGGKWTLSLGIISTAIFSLLTPMVIKKGGLIALIVLRVLMGLGEGTIFPAIAVLLSKWVPEKERSRIGSIVFGGGQIGSVIAYFGSDLILEHLMWSWVFYIWGSLAIIWFIVFTIICYSDPASHPCISKKERNYLEKEIGSLKRKTDLPPTPWNEIITSKPMLALICAQIGHDWGFYIVVSELPKYMNDVLKLSVIEIGLYASLPFIAMWIFAVASGFLSDFLIARQCLSITCVRKLFTAIAAIFPGLLILAASYSGKDHVLVVTSFALAISFMGTYHSSMKVNPLDLSPNYAGSLMALTNGIGALTEVAAPRFVGYMTPNISIEEWRIVFWTTFGIYFVTTFIYCIGASGEIQLWNYPKEWEEPETTDNEMINIDAK